MTDEELLKAIRQIVREELQAVGFHAHLNSNYGITPEKRLEISRLAQETLRQIREKRDKEQQLVDEIRRECLKIPPEYRPHPDQYKSISRKHYVLEMVKDPARWSEIPGLSKQWMGRKRK